MHVWNLIIHSISNCNKKKWNVKLFSWWKEIGKRAETNVKTAIDSSITLALKITLRKYTIRFLSVLHFRVITARLWCATWKKPSITKFLRVAGFVFSSKPQTFFSLLFWSQCGDEIYLNACRICSLVICPVWTCLKICSCRLFWNSVLSWSICRLSTCEK